MSASGAPRDSPWPPTPEPASNPASPGPLFPDDADTGPASSASRAADPVQALQVRLLQAVQGADIKAQAQALLALNEAEVDEAVLEQTGVGSTVQKLAGPLAPQAGALIKKWKATVKAQKKGLGKMKVHAKPRTGLSPQATLVAVQRCTQRLQGGAAATADPATINKVLDILGALDVTRDIAKASGVVAAVESLPKQ